MSTMSPYDARMIMAARVLELETELSEAYILNDKARIKFLEKTLQEMYENLED